MVNRTRNLQTKIFAVEDIKAKLGAAKTVALIDYQGLNSNQIADLRDKISQAGGKMEVVKNTLISRSLAGLSIDLPQTLTGPTALVFSNEDEVASLKVVENLRKQLEKPQFKYGVYQGKLISADEVLKLAQLPAKEILISQFIGGLANPLIRLMGALRYNQTKLVLVLKAMGDRN